MNASEAMNKRTANVRIIAATNADLENAILENRFRAGSLLSYQRLSHIPAAPADTKR